MNAGDQLQGKTLERGRRAFCGSLWMAFGPLDIMCKTNKSIACGRATHFTLILFCPNPALFCMMSFGLQAPVSTCYCQEAIFAWLGSLGNSRHLSSSATAEG